MAVCPQRGVRNLSNLSSSSFSCLLPQSVESELLLLALPCLLVCVCVCAQLFRSDLISAMKLPDSLPMESGSYFTIKEPWRREWEFGVQVSQPFFPVFTLIKVAAHYLRLAISTHVYVHSSQCELVPLSTIPPSLSPPFPNWWLSLLWMAVTCCHVYTCTMYIGYVPLVLELLRPI